MGKGMKVSIAVACGMAGAFFLSGVIHYTLTGRDYATTDSEALEWLGGTWIVFSLVIWAILALFKKGNEE